MNAFTLRLSLQEEQQKKIAVFLSIFKSILKTMWSFVNFFSSGRGAHVMFSVNVPPFCKLLLFPVTF